MDFSEFDVFPAELPEVEDGGSEARPSRRDIEQAIRTLIAAAGDASANAATTNIAGNGL